MLTGKYTSQNAGTAEKSRGDIRADIIPSFTEKDFALLNTLSEIARELETTSAAVALAWVQGHPGVTATNIGVHTLKQLNENLTALDLLLSPAHIAALNKLSEPTLDFPSPYLTYAPTSSHAGATVNGVSSTIISPTLLKNEKERY